jgi:hypothetical protein
VSIWLDILRKAAVGDSKGARALLANELPLALSEPVFGSKTFQYRGPLPRAVAGFISRLPERERSLARSVAEDFTDYIVDDVVAGVERTLSLVELCVTGNATTVDELVDDLPWAPGLKLGQEWKRQRVADELRSMLELGVPLPETVIDFLGAEGEAKFDFNEIGFAMGARRLILSWQDFKRQQQIDDRFACVLDSEDDSSAAAESFDYGSITMARVALQKPAPGDLELKTDLRLLGAILGPQLTSILESMHNAKPREGYHPIAWHNVFWNVSSDYESLRLAIEMLDPFCSTDQKLADWVADNYREVTGTSRPVILRRRKALHDACEGHIHTVIHEKFGGGEHPGPQITHDREGSTT